MTSLIDQNQNTRLQGRVTRTPAARPVRQPTASFSLEKSRNALKETNEASALGSKSMGN
jgi:hypothetical protein